MVSVRKSNFQWKSGRERRTVRYIVYCTLLRSAQRAAAVAF